MRLTQREKAAIRDAVAVFDPDAQVYVFGSRADDSMRGGDIDLLIISYQMDPSTIRPLRLRLHDQLGEQKIDIVISQPTLDDPFARKAYLTGVRL